MRSTGSKSLSRCQTMTGLRSGGLLERDGDVAIAVGAGKDDDGGFHVARRGLLAMLGSGEALVPPLGRTGQAPAARPCQPGTAPPATKAGPVGSGGQRAGPLQELERVVPDMVAGHLLAQERLGDDALVDAFAQQREEEPLLVRVGMRAS